MSEKSIVAAIEQAEQSGHPLRWLDWTDYGQKVILNGKDVPWGDPTALVQFFGQGAALLKLGVSDLNLGVYFDWWLRDNPAALEARQETYWLRAQDVSGQSLTESQPEGNHGQFGSGEQHPTHVVHTFPPSVAPLGS